MNTKTIRLIRPSINLVDVLPDFENIFSSGIFSSGNYNKEFRLKLKQFIGSNHISLTTSATTALWSCLKMLKIGKGDEVLISDFSFPATANVVEDLGAKPVLVDVNPDTFNSEASEIERLISKKTKAIIFVDALGNPSGVSKVSKLSKHYKIPLIEDAACSIGSSENNINCGNIADVTCFSFHPRKLICAGEGGAISTNNKNWKEWFDLKLAHGGKKSDGHFSEFKTFGYNFRLSEIQSAMSLIQIDNLKNLIKSRKEIFSFYKAELNKFGFEEQKISNSAKTNYQTIAFKVPKIQSRDQLIYFLKDHNIETTIGTYSISSIKYYNSKYKFNNINSRYLMNSSIALPCYEGVDCERVVETIKRFLK